MEMYIVRHDYWASLYNCTGIDVNSVPLPNRQFIPEAFVTFLLSFIYFTLYIPCMCSIWKQMSTNDCYKLLFYIGVADMSVLVVIGFMQTWFGLNGSAFCSSPDFYYILGTITTGLWCAESTSDLVLAFNRCLATVWLNAHNALFKGRKMHVWLLLCTLYALYGFLIEKPLLYAPTVFAWSYNPLEGYKVDTQNIFVNDVNDVIETTVALGSPSIYLVFGVMFWIKNRTIVKGKVPLTEAEKSTFLQVFLISALNSTMCSLALLFHRFPAITTEWMVLIAQFAWLHIHGFPPVIYLVLNKTIRSDCRKMLLKLLGASNQNNTHMKNINVVSKKTNGPIHNNYT